MDIEIGGMELNGFALMMAAIASLITVVMFKFAGFGTEGLGVGVFWKILTPIVTFVVAYIYIDRMN
jgi:hypothetical protein